MEKRYIASLILHAIGDTIGYNNSKWEFMIGDNTKVWEKISQFIAYGGVNNVPSKGWIVSDDTIMHLMIAEALTEKYSSVNSLGKITAEKFIEAHDLFVSEGLELRRPGVTILKNIRKIKDGLKWNHMDYDFKYGGSGASMRSSCIGLIYHGEENRDNLMSVAIETSRITHNSSTGYLGGYVAALFTALAIENVDIKKWPFILMDIFNNRKISKYIQSIGRDVGDYENDKHYFIKKWKRYIDDKFDDDGKVIKRKSSINLRWRADYYSSFIEKSISGNHSFPGSAGDDSVIIAYDCLLDSEKSWEKLVVYSMLHSGDTDTTGCIAGSWYGALYGFEDVPINILEHLEFKDKIQVLAKKLYKKATTGHKK
jgi:ADP-ribosylarginine hydrolase